MWNNAHYAISKCTRTNTHTRTHILDKRQRSFSSTIYWAEPSRVEQSSEKNKARQQKKGKNARTNIKNGIPAWAISNVTMRQKPLQHWRSKQKKTNQQQQLRQRQQKDKNSNNKENNNDNNIK